jgi:hypothetical protein
MLVDEARGRTARVHDPVEIRQARLAEHPLLLRCRRCSARAVTRRWAAAAAHARGRAGSARRPQPLIALGGMDARRFRWCGGWAFRAGRNRRLAGADQNLKAVPT